MKYLLVITMLLLQGCSDLEIVKNCKSVTDTTTLFVCKKI